MIHIETAKNLVTLRYNGHVTVEQSEHAFEELQQALQRVEPGFQLLTDLSTLEIMDYDCAPSIKKAMDVMREKGISHVVRVIPDPHKDIGFNIMSHFHYGHGVRITTCATLEEARQELEEG
jgi:hypothetical protein